MSHAASLQGGSYCLWHYFSIRSSTVQPRTACALLRYISWYAWVIVFDSSSHNILDIESVVFFLKHIEIGLVSLIITRHSQHVEYILFGNVKALELDFGEGELGFQNNLLSKLSKLHRSG